jgi:hypothetical protein
MAFALIMDGQVLQIEAETFPVNPSLVWVDCSATPGVAFGWTAMLGDDGVWSFTPPVTPPVEPEPKPQQITSTAFLNRFTDQERGALYTAAMSNPQMLGLLITCAAAGTIDLTDDGVQAGINGLVPGVLATTARASAILDH